jgi:hypothetical protein
MSLKGRELVIRRSDYTPDNEDLARTENPPRNRFPLPIPDEKREIASRLYLAIRAAEEAESSIDKAFTKYIYTMNFISDMESLVFFGSKTKTPPLVMSSIGDRVSQLSAKLLGHDSKTGKVPQIRQRKGLTTKTKAAAALRRYLGTCPDCRRLKLPVSFRIYVPSYSANVVVPVRPS